MIVSQKQHWRRRLGNGEEGLSSSEAREGGSGEAHGAEVVGVSGGEEVARVHRLLHEAAPLLAPPHGVFIVDPRRRAPHWSGVGW